MPAKTHKWICEYARPASEHPLYATACKLGGRYFKKWLRTWVDVVAVMKHGCTFDDDAAQRVVDFFEKVLKHSKGRWAGLPFKLLPWEEFDVIRPLFGWKRPDGTRRFRVAWIEVPKKNGKSELAAGVGLYLLTADGEAGPEVYAAAVDRKQAGIVHRQSDNMRKQSPLLAGMLKSIPSTKTITYPKMNGVYRALSADVESQEGLDWSGLLFDELHAHKKRALWDATRYGGAARSQALLFAISTGGIFNPLSIGYEQHEYAVNVLEGGMEDHSFFAYIRGAREDEDWTDPEVWRRANPSIDTILDIEDIRQQCKEAQNVPAKQNSFRRYRLNVWTRAFSRWLDIRSWRNCADPLPIEAMAGRDVWLGLDLSQKEDLSALTLSFRPTDTDPRYRVYPFFWLPRDGLEDHEKRNNAPYTQWARDGFLETTDGARIDYQAIRAKINELSLTHNIKEIAMDPAFGGELMQQLQDEDGFEVLQFFQGFKSMNDPVDQVENLVIDGGIAHNDHPILVWHMSNAEVKQDAGGRRRIVKPDNSNSPKKVDGVVALLMSLYRAILVGGEESSVYNDRAAAGEDMLAVIGKGDSAKYVDEPDAPKPDAPDTMLGRRYG